MHSVQPSYQPSSPIGTESRKPLGWIVRQITGGFDDYADGEVVRRFGWYRSMSEAHASVIEGTTPDSHDAATIAGRYEVLPIFIDPDGRKSAPDAFAQVASILAQLDALHHATGEIVRDSGIGLSDREKLADAMDAAQCRMVNVLLHIAEQAAQGIDEPTTLAGVSVRLAALAEQCDALPAPHDDDARQAIDAATATVQTFTAAP